MSFSKKGIICIEERGKKRKKKLIINIVRTSFGLDPKTGLGPGPISPNNELVERGRKKQPDFRNEITIMGGLEEKLRV